jgi:hypothetical protein
MRSTVPACSSSWFDCAWLAPRGHGAEGTGRDPATRRSRSLESSLTCNNVEPTEAGALKAPRRDVGRAGPYPHVPASSLAANKAQQAAGRDPHRIRTPCGLSLRRRTSRRDPRQRRACSPASLTRSTASRSTRRSGDPAARTGPRASCSSRSLAARQARRCRSRQVRPPALDEVGRDGVVKIPAFNAARYARMGLRRGGAPVGKVIVDLRESIGGDVAARRRWLRCSSEGAGCDRGRAQGRGASLGRSPTPSGRADRRAHGRLDGGPAEVFAGRARPGEATTSGGDDGGMAIVQKSSRRPRAGACRPSGARVLCRARCWAAGSVPDERVVVPTEGERRPPNRGLRSSGASASPQAAEVTR